MLYQIELTPPAEEVYLSLYDRAQPYLDDGKDRHPAVVTFNAVEDAMDSIAKNPCNPELALAGVCSILYRIPLDSVSICYVVNPSKPEVIVLTITETSTGLRMWLVTAIKDGHMDGLLQSLQIENPEIKVAVTSGMLH